LNLFRFLFKEQQQSRIDTTNINSVEHLHGERYNPHKPNAPAGYNTTASLISLDPRSISELNEYHFDLWCITHQAVYLWNHHAMSGEFY